MNTYQQDGSKIEEYNSIGLLGTTYSVSMSYILTYLQKIRPESILEIGAGTGRLLRYLSENLDHKPKFIGIDKSLQMIGYAKNIGGQIVYKHFDRIIPLPENSIDVVLCANVLEEIEINEVIEILKEIRRVLKDQGTLIITYTNPYAISSQADFISYGYSHNKKKLNNEDSVKCYLKINDSKNWIINDHFREVDYLKQIFIGGGFSIKKIAKPLGKKRDFITSDETKIAPDIIWFLKKRNDKNK